VFSVQTERVVSKDNTVAIKDRWWQIEKCRWRYSLEGFRFDTARTWWAATAPTASHWQPGLRYALNAPPDGDARLRYGRATSGTLKTRPDN